jgi:hypothetical protein
LGKVRQEKAGTEARPTNSFPKRRITLITIVWEEIKQEGISWIAKRGLYRTKVPGGWLVRTQTSDSDFLVFLPDPDHQWQ